VAKQITEEKWDTLAGHRAATSGFTLAQAIACTVDFDDQHYGIYAGGGDSYPDFAEVFDQTSPQLDLLRVGAPFLLDCLLITTSTPRSTMARQLTSHPGSPRPASSSSITLLFGNFIHNYQALVPSPAPLDLNPKQSQIKIQVQLGLG